MASYSAFETDVNALYICFITDKSHPYTVTGTVRACLSAIYAHGAIYTYMEAPPAYTPTGIEYTASGPPDGELLICGGGNRISTRGQALCTHGQNGNDKVVI